MNFLLCGRSNILFFFQENIDNDEFIAELTDSFPRLPIDFVEKLMSSEVVDEGNAEMFFQVFSRRFGKN